jgi:hypothetical protein
MTANGPIHRSRAANIFSRYGDFEQKPERVLLTQGTEPHPAVLDTQGFYESSIVVQYFVVTRIFNGKLDICNL